MKRDYHSSNKKNNIQEGITYFQGVEIEHTPAYGMDTLFVVGMQDPEEVIGIATRKNVQHI